MDTRLTGRFSLLLLAFAVVMFIFPAMAFAQAAPTIQSDKDDYEPGELVTLTGSGWQAAESVHIFVNDDIGQTWSRDVDVTADASGNITDQFNLPDWFVATYSVKATGESGALATTSFLDSNVQVGANLSTGNSTNVGWQRYNSTDCTGTALTGASNTGTLTLNGSATSPINGGATSGSIKLTADLQSSPASTKKAFNNWEPSGSATSANMSAVAGSGDNVTCTSGFNNGNNTHVYTANYGNTAPSTPGTPSTGSNPNQGVFTLSWTASTDAEGNPITYRLEHKSASDTSYSLVTGAGNLSTNSFAFTSAAQENEGTWTYRVQASDTSAAGSLSSAFSADSAAIKVDKTAPETTINSKPADPTNSTSASFGFSSNETGSTFQCSIDNGSFSSCASPKSYSSLANGPHTFRVRATDAAGNVEATPASYTWTVDRTAPSAPVINSPANNSSVGASFTLSGTAEANSTVELFEGTTSKGTTQASASGNWSITLNNVSAGSHTYTAKATDAAGNTSALSTGRTVIVDTTAPTATITSGPASGSTVNSASASFGFSSNETGSTFECSLDGAAYTTCSSPQNYTNLSDGSHTFSVKATDAVGNTGTPVSRTWTVSTDSVAPTTTASAKNADNTTYNSGDWTKQNVTVSLSATDNTGGSGVKQITYSASGAQTIAQTDASGSSVTLPVINTEGTTTVTYKATDNAGNVEANKTFTVKIDKTAPTITPADVNNTTWRNTDLSANFTASDTESGLAANQGLDANNGFTLTASAESANANTPTTVSKTITDQAGNSTTRSLSAKIDKTNPAPNCGSASTSWLGSDASITCAPTDGLSGLAASTPTSFSLVTSVASDTEDSNASTNSRDVFDAAGNKATAGPISGNKIDKKAPNTTADAGTYNGGWTNQSVTVTLSANDGGSGVKTTEYSIDGGAFQAYTSGGISVSSDGDHTILYRSTDNVNNQEQNKSFTVKVDKTAPTITDLGPTSPPNGNNNWYTTNVTNTFKASDSGSGLSDACKANFPLTAGDNVQSKTTTGEGSAVKVTSDGCSDVAGNSAADKDSAGFKVDLTNPKADHSLSAPANANGWHKANVTVTLSATDKDASGVNDGSGGKEISYSVNNGAAQTYNSTDKIVLTNDGEYTIKYTATDNAGRASAEGSVTVKLDKTAPVVKNSADLDADVVKSGWFKADVSENFTASDAASGIDYAASGPSSINSADGSFTLTASANSVKNNDGTFTPTKVTQTVKDKAGNETKRSLSAQIDKVNPNISASTANQPDPNTGWYNISTGAPIVHFECSDALSGIQSCPANHTITAEGTNLGYSDTAYDVAGNSASAGVSGLKSDQQRPASPDAPDLLASSDTGASDTDNITSESKPTFRITAEEGSKVELYAQKGSAAKELVGSGSVTNGSVTITATTSSGGSLSDGTYTFSATATDQAGNVSVSDPLKVTIVTVDTLAPDAPTGLDMAAASDTGVSPTDDKTKNDTPVISGNAEKGSDVKLYNSDGTSVVGSAKADATTGNWSITTSVLSEGEHSLTAKATDAAGNTSQASGALVITIDKTAPVITDNGPRDPRDGNAASDGNYGWYVTEAFNKFSASDGSGTGLAILTQANFERGSGAQEGVGVKVASGPVSDVAGNTAPSIDSKGYDIDRTAPTIKASLDKQAAPSGWFNANTGAPTVSFQCSDATPGSGLAGACPDSHTFGNGANQSHSGTISDVAGNHASDGVSGINVDLVAPSITDLGPTSQPNAAGWFKSAVTNQFRASDGLSGFSGGKTDPYTFDQSSGNQQGLGVKVASGPVSDVAGNTAPSTDSVGFNIDKTAPTLNPSVSPNPVLLKGAATADPGASDALSGIASASCDPVDTSTVGTKSVSCSATDKAGNSANASASYSVNYKFDGYRQPVDNNGVLNSAKAGQAIPIKFSLFGNQGLSIFSTAVTPNPKVTKVSCPSGATVDTIEEYSATTNSGLTYDATADQYNYVWKTQSAYAGSCYKFDMVLIDGTHHEAFFKFTK